jgi:hypothetical protein
MAYGYDTHSWRNSTEHRQTCPERSRRMQQQCAAETARYLASPRVVVDVYPQCHCDAAPYPHDPEFWHGQPWPRVWTRRRTPSPSAATGSTRAQF